MIIDKNVETWKDIPNYEGLYQVSNFGRVKGLDRFVTGKDGVTQFKKGKILKNKMGTNNYHYVILYKNNKSKTFMNHSLTALLFISERPNNHEICHLDGDKLNNHVNNLRYDTRSENRIDEYRIGKKNPKGKLSIEQVLSIRKIGENSNMSSRQIAEKYNISSSQVRSILNRVSYKWLNDDGTIIDSKTAVKI